ncbi:hypothetical protein [Curtobacterium sp. BRD11]|uniref:hypothetical protein n=1 Tax=Curtobacterium sp. BRD11 TaxID=2962581 RepID=UPI002881C164|nr:hypothetical protein [Curtobacterium sp. BRD11]MDT0209006.1 hypothetical protein [Curtobacterium sp. BRD11]
MSTEVSPETALADVDAFVSTPSFKRDPNRTGAGIRVVNVAATYRSEKSRPGVEAEPVSQVSPRFGRAHWRRQQFRSGVSSHPPVG